MSVGISWRPCTSASRRSKVLIRKISAAPKGTSRVPGKQRRPARKSQSLEARPGGPPPTIRVLPAQKRKFRERLLKWYTRHGRDLPWRRTRDPYHILVSEIMLQQTQVDRVLPKYHQFLERYPTLEDLASARARDVRQLWYPLGYNIRPARLHRIARETVARYGGRLPDTAEGLRGLPGIGRYTAGAVLSFAYGQDAAILDTNVRRVLSRVFIGPHRAR